MAIRKNNVDVDKLRSQLSRARKKIKKMQSGAINPTQRKGAQSVREDRNAERPYAILTSQKNGQLPLFAAVVLTEAMTQIADVLDRAASPLRAEEVRRFRKVG